MRRTATVTFKADRISSMVAIAAIAVLLGGGAGVARAGLGDTLSPGAAGLTVREAQPAYTMVEQIDPASGATIDQYVATGSGQVFAITWSGPHRPSLRALFSSYFGAYADALAKSRMHSLHVVHIDTGSLVVDMSGHPGDFRGSAWAPPLVPSGIDISTLLR